MLRFTTALTLVFLSATFSASAGSCTCPQDRASDGDLCGATAASVRPGGEDLAAVCEMLEEQGLDNRSLAREGSPVRDNAPDPRSFGAERPRSPAYEPLCGLYEFGCNASGR